MHSDSLRMPSASALHSWLRLVRWQNAMLASAGVAFGAWWAGGGAAARVLSAMAAAVVLTAAANAWNDAADVEIDRIAHPDRPLPAGVLSVDDARRLAGACAVAGVVLAGIARPVLAVATVPVTLAMALYSPRLKRLGLPGNLTVATLASLPFLYGAWAVGRPGDGVPLVALAMPLHFAREIAKDIDDAVADAPARRTLPVRDSRAARLALGASIALFLAGLAPLVAGRPVLMVALLPTVGLVAAATSASWRGRAGGPTLLKAAMLCAMAAFVIARG